MRSLLDPNYFLSILKFLRRTSLFVILRPSVCLEVFWFLEETGQLVMLGIWQYYPWGMLQFMYCWMSRGFHPTTPAHPKPWSLNPIDPPQSPHWHPRYQLPKTFSQSPTIVLCPLG